MIYLSLVKQLKKCLSLEIDEKNGFVADDDTDTDDAPMKGTHLSAPKFVEGTQYNQEPD